MSSSIDRAKYFAGRKLGMSVNSAGHYARHRQSPSLVELVSGRQNNLYEARIDLDGFQVHVRVIQDDTADEIVLGGRFTDKWSRNVVKNPSARGRNGNRYRSYFEPETSYAEYRKYLLGETPKDPSNPSAPRCNTDRRGKHEAHTLARKHVLDAVNRAVACGNDWSPVGVKATAYRHGVELGSMSVWGFASDDKEGLRDAADEMAGVAVHEAKQTLGKLCECAAPSAP